MGGFPEITSKVSIFSTANATSVYCLSQILDTQSLVVVARTSPPLFEEISGTVFSGHTTLVVLLTPVFPLPQKLRIFLFSLYSPGAPSPVYLLQTFFDTLPTTG